MDSSAPLLLDGPACPSPDVGEEGIDVPREHSDHVGDDEGCGRPSHQQEGDEGHSPEEAQHRGERALRWSGREAGLLRAAWRRWPRHRQVRRGGKVAPGQLGQAQPRREGNSQKPEGGVQTGSRVGGAQAVLACCETGEVTKPQPGPARGAPAPRPPPRPRHAGPLGFLSILLGTAFAWGAAGDAVGAREAGQLLRNPCSVSCIPRNWFPPGLPPEPLSNTPWVSFQRLPTGDAHPIR